MSCKLCHFHCVLTWLYLFNLLYQVVCGKNCTPSSTAVHFLFSPVVPVATSVFLGDDHPHWIHHQRQHHLHQPTKRSREGDEQSSTQSVYHQWHQVLVLYSYTLFFSSIQMSYYDPPPSPRLPISYLFHNVSRHLIMYYLVSFQSKKSRQILREYCYIRNCVKTHPMSIFQS